jgi:2,4-dienoyl-CoA reductase (NADPH2)
MAKKVPGKEEFEETIRYFRRQLELTKVTLKLGQRVAAEDLAGFDVVVLATGVRPRQIQLDGIDHPKALSYVDVLRHGAEVGQRVAIIGAGGIGFDVAEFLAHKGESTSLNMEAFMEEWGIDPTYAEPGALKPEQDEESAREIILCQRKAGKLGAGLGKTTGWIHRTALKKKQVMMVGDCSYTRIDDDGLHLSIGGEERVLEVDNVVICAGQVPLRDLQDPLKEQGIEVHLIGGADVASELDAKRAIAQGARLAMDL